jgi:hypothetical protein
MLHCAFGCDTDCAISTGGFKSYSVVFRMPKIRFIWLVLIAILGSACASHVGGHATSSPSAGVATQTTTAPTHHAVRAKKTPQPTATPRSITPKPSATHHATSTPTRHHVPTPPSPASVVRAYIAAINRADYTAAWRIISPAVGGSYDGFAAGFAGTDYDQLTIAAVDGSRVQIDLIAYQTDGSHKHYQGAYSVSGGHIVDTHIVQLSAPTPAPAPTDLCGAPDNPWGYNFCAGTLITTPPADFCTYFSCIANFPNGIGYVVQCVDGDFSKSGGRRGACSYHDGEGQALYAP